MPTKPYKRKPTRKETIEALQAGARIRPGIGDLDRFHWLLDDGKTRRELNDLTVVDLWKEKLIERDPLSLMVTQIIGSMEQRAELARMSLSYRWCRKTGAEQDGESILSSGSGDATKRASRKTLSTSERG